jgi:hypothetical protein
LPRQPGLWSVDDRLRELSEQGDPLEILEIVDLELFRPALAEAIGPKDRAKGGRSAFDAVLRFKMLYLMAQHGLSFEQTERLVRDRLSLQGLLALSPSDRDREKPCGSPLPHHRAYGSVPRRFVGLSGSGRHDGKAERGQICVRERDVEGRAGSDPAMKGLEAFHAIPERDRASRPWRGPCALPAVCAASRRGTPCLDSCRNRFHPLRHCFQAPPGTAGIRRHEKLTP